MGIYVCAFFVVNFEVSMEENEELKIGAMISRANKQKLQAAHDALAELGVECQTVKSIGDDAFVFFGDEVKATQLDDGNVKLGGYLVRFGDPTKTDLAGDYFTKNTDFGDAEKSDGWFNHRLPVSFKGKRVQYAEQLPDVKLTKDEIGVFGEIVLGARNEYEKLMAEMGLAGKLGWSSGTAPHLVDRKQVGNANEITRWKLGLDASLTPTPAEFRNNVMPIKSLITPEAAATDNGDTKAVQNLQEKNNMDTNEIKTLLEDNNKSLVAVIEEKSQAAATKAVADVLDKLPEVKAKMNATVQVLTAAEDREFKSVGENAIAIAKHTKGLATHPRIRGLQAKAIAAAKDSGDEASLEAAYKAALGSNEGIPSQGEFLLEPTISRDLIKPIHEQGVFSTKVRKLPVGPNSNSGWIPGVDETSRATGSRWGGVRGYHAAEAASMTASQPKFRKINWELHKTYVLQYATDELLNDAPMLTAIVNQSSAEELNFMVNDDLLNGIGGDRPVGVLNSGALVSISRAATSAISHADILNMWQRLHPRFRAGAEWYVNSEVETQLDALTFTSGSTGILSPYVRYDANGVMNVKGRPVNVTEFNPALGTAGDILLANFDDYLMWEKGAIEAAMSIHVQFLTDQTAFRFIARYDGQTALASAITPYKGSNTQSPFVTLLATT